MYASARPVRLPPLLELGSDLVQVTGWQRWRSLTLPFVAFAAFWLFAGTGNWTAAVFSLVVLSFATYGSTSHDLVHRNLGLSRLSNDILLSMIEAMALRSGHAYQAAHLYHHARFPHEDDVEARAARMSLVRALLEGVVFQLQIYAWALRHSRGKRGWMVGEGAVVLAALIGAIAALPYTIIPGIYVALMVAGSWVIPLITAYLPHDPQSPDPLRQTRLFRGMVARLVAFDHLYHLEHHLYPAVPHHNWPELARRLDPWFQAAGIEPVRLWR